MVAIQAICVPDERYETYRRMQFGARLIRN